MTQNAMQQVSLDEFRRTFGEKYFETTINILTTLKNRLTKESRFTGKIVFTVNCRNGGIGNTEAFIQSKIENT